MNQNHISTDRLIDDLRVVVRDAEELLKATADEVGDKAREARERLNATIAQAKATCRQLEEKAYAQAQAAEDLIREKPYQSLGIAFGIGFLLGVILKKK